MSFKVEILTSGAKKYCGDGLRFKEKKAAETYAVNLYQRWLTVKSYRVVESKDEPNS